MQNIHRIVFLVSLLLSVAPLMGRFQGYNVTQAGLVEAKAESARLMNTLTDTPTSTPTLSSTSTTTPTATPPLTPTHTVTAMPTPDSVYLPYIRRDIPPSPTPTPTATSTPTRSPRPPAGRFETAFLPPGYRIMASATGSLFLYSPSLHRSDDGGATWWALTDPANYANKVALAISPAFAQDQTLFVGLDYGNDAVRISRDGGRSWHSPAQPVIGPVLNIALSPNFAVDQTVYVATNAYTGITLLRSTDAGEHWQNLSLPGNALAQQVVLSPAFPMDQVVFVTTRNGRGVWRSNDGGFTWVPTSAGLELDPYEAVRVAAISPNYPADGTLFAAVRRGLYTSTNRGQSWRRVSSVRTYWPIAIAPDFATSRTLFLIESGSDSRGLLYSTDAGQTWTTAVTGSSDVVFSPGGVSGYFVYTLAYALHRSADRGKTWQTISWADFRCADYTCTQIVPSPNFDQDGIVFMGPIPRRSTDAGRTWTTMLLPEDGKFFLAVSPAFASDRTVFALISSRLEFTLYHHLYKSTDAGDHWTRVASDPPLGNQVFRLPRLRISPNYAVDRTLFIAAYGSGIFRSTDDGATWHLLGTGIPAYVTDLEVSPGYPADPTLFVTVYNDGIFRSDDSGATWIQLSRPTFSPEFNVELSPTFHRDNTLFVAVNGSGGAFRSEDRGNTWVDITGSVLNYFVLTAAVSPRFEQDRTVLMAREGGPLLISEDAGSTWFPLYGIPRDRVYGLAIAYRDNLLMLLASTEQGIYRYRWP